MKPSFVLVCTCAIFSIKTASGSAIGAPFYPLNPEDLLQGDIKELEYWDKYYHRPKRSQSAWSTGSGSGSADIINDLKTAVVAGLKQKIVQVAKGSAGAVAGASAGFSKGSFGGDSKGYHSPAYEPPIHDVDDHKSFNIWELKKSVLNTLLQAVKAIKGGVLAIKGQLIKGSGYIVSGGGKLITASGDKVTKLGKDIINNAVLVPPNKGHYSQTDYGTHPSGHSAPSGPPVAYEVPVSSGQGLESNYESLPFDHLNDKPYGTHAGILLLRRIPSTHDKYHSSHSHIQESVIPAFKPLSSTGPSFGNVVGKFFTASTSLKTSEPSPFTDSDFHHGHSYDVSSHGLGLEESRHHYGAPAVSYQAPLVPEHNVISNADFSTSSSDFGGHLQPPSSSATNYGVPFEESLGFQNINDHLSAEASVTKEQKVKLTKGELLDHLDGSPTLASSEVQLPKDAPDSLQALKSSVDTNNNGKTLGPPFNSDYLPNNQVYRSNTATKLSSSEEVLPTNYPRNALYSEKDNAVSSGEFLDNPRFKKTTSKEIFSQRLEPNNLLANFLPQEDASSFSGSQEASSELTSKESYMKFLENFPFHKTHPIRSPGYKYPTSRPKSSQKLRTLRLHRDYKQRKPSSRPDFSVMKSVSYELTPQGAKRLT